MTEKMATIENTCSVCNVAFERNVKHNNRFKKQSIESKIHRRDSSFKDVLSNIIDITPGKDEKTFVCMDCGAKIGKCGDLMNSVQQLQSAANKNTYLGQKILKSPRTPRSLQKRRRIVTSTPITRYRRHTPNLKSTSTSFQQNGFKGSIQNYLRASRYTQVFRTCLKQSVAARKSFRKVVGDEIRKEMRTLCSPKFNSIWRNGTKDGIHAFERFSWEQSVNEAKEVAPVLLSALTGALHNKTNKGMSILPNISSILGQMVFAIKPLHMKFLQELIGLQMWLSGASKLAFKRLNKLALTLGTDGVRYSVDRIRKSFDEELKKAKSQLTTLRRWKNDPVVQRLFDPPDEDALRVLNDTHPYVDDCDDFPVDDHENDTIPYDSLSDMDQENEDFDRGSCAETHVVNAHDVMDVDDDRINEQNYDVALQNQDDSKDCAFGLVFDNINKHVRAHHTTKDTGNVMLNMVQAYAALDRVPSLHLSDNFPSHEEVRNISPDIFLPTNEEKEHLRSSYVSVVKEILEEHIVCFQKEYPYMPEDEPVHEYSKQSKKKSHVIPLGVLKKDENKIAEMIDIMRVYQQYVPGDPPEESFVTPLFGDALSVERAYDAQDACINGHTPWAQLQGLHPSIQEWHKRGILLKDTFKILFSGKSCRSIGTLSYIANCYRHVNVKTNIIHCFNEATDLLRFATTCYVLATALEILGCKSFSEVPNYFEAKNALEVANMIVEMCYTAPNYEALKNASTSSKEVFKKCICRNDTGGDMIRCGNKKCGKGKWFHYECVGVDPEITNNNDLVPDDWFCSEECKQLSMSETSPLKDDMVFRYSMALLWRGLGELARHQAIRTNNGPLMLAFWKEDMIEFFQMNHTKYFLCGHRLIMDTNGALSERLSHQIKWNRTVNIKGGQTNNLEMDLMMEFMNKEFKESVKDASGNLSENTIARHGEMVGVGKQVGLILDSLCATNSRTKKSGTTKMANDIKHLTNILLEQQCCVKQTKGRCHNGFGDFAYHTSTSHPITMKKRILKHIKKRAARLRLLNARA